ncbi:rhomboid family intramembrane serine protease [Candidatus Nanohalococcus occultus]|uniref:rhomboid family intramembrane serine protease n=1 Tax=Candidatus Nanohalococcus occultus TaxID=2978047 RepID=UPI0039DFB3AF
MANCSKCGKQEMTFKCRYCEQKFCTEHRLPENHDCDGLDEAKTKSGSEDKWFVEKDTTTRSPRPRKPSIAKDLKRTITNNATMAIIAFTVVSFFLQLIPGYTQFLNLSPALTQSAVEATNQAAIQAGYSPVLDSTVLGKPWSMFTVMITHNGMFHIFANMVTFYFFGTVLERKIGSIELTKFYIVSGVIASIGYIVFRNLMFYAHGPIMNSFPTLSPAVGASGAVVAVFAAVAVLYPDAEVLLYFFIPMKIKNALYIFTGFEALNLTTNLIGMPLPVIGNFASSAHLTGLLCGVYFGRKLRDKYRSKPGVLELFG